DQAVAADAFSISITVSDGVALSEAMTPGYAASIDTSSARVSASFTAERFVPDGDFELAYQRADAAPVHVATYAPRAREFGDDSGRAYAAVRLHVELPDGAPAPERKRIDRAIAVDVSHSQSKETIAEAATLAARLLRDLDPGERFVVLACDSACDAYPEDGLAASSDDEIKKATAFLAARAPGGSSDLAGAALEAAHRLGGSASAQAVILGDGAPTSGELSAAAIARRVRPALEGGHVDLRLLGIGRTVDEVVLADLARALDAGYARAADGRSTKERGDDLAIALRRPLVRAAKLTLPSGFDDVLPARLPSLALGEDVTVLARVEPGARSGDVTLEGTLDGAAYKLARAAKVEDGGFQNAIVPRLWAEARIADLEAADDKDTSREVVALSKAFHVMSRKTSLLVLENDRMFSAYGIERTTKGAADQSDHVFGMVGGAPLATSAEPSAFGAMGVLGGASVPEPMSATSPWGASAGSDPMSARGNMWGDGVGPSLGAGGLGLSGVGEGGSGKGDGIGLGSIGTIGHGASNGAGQGFGSGHGRLGGSHKSSAPQVRMGASQVSGRMPPEVIQRVVRMNFGRFRLCYEQALAKDANLQGRVSVRFLIARDGSVAASSDGGSDIGDANMVQCVVNAFRSLSFPTLPDSSGPVTVVYPLQFASDGTRPTSPPRAPEKPVAPLPAEKVWPLRPDEMPPKPLAHHRAGDERWRSSSDAVVAKARSEAASDPASRKRREALVRALLGRGQFDEARVVAEAFADADPDSVVASELVAEARAATGDGAGALTAVDAAVESAPRSTTAHGRAARAFEAAGDERRACAHWRSLAELEPGDDGAIAESLRCRARSADGRATAEAEAKDIDKRGPRVAALVAAFERGDAPAFEDHAPAGGLVAKVTCADGHERCGAVVVVTPQGIVVSPWTPGSWRAGAGEVAVGALWNGAYKTRLVGASVGVRATVTVRALGATRAFELDPTSPDETAAITQLENMEWGS
ncbi:MAG TPA: AgmX/PglI C-terminal domain-containing protein, partial [Byssovorax sp.]